MHADSTDRRTPPTLIDRAITVVLVVDTAEDRDQSFERLLEIDAELATEQLERRDRWLLMLEQFQIEDQIRGSLSRLGPYGPWSEREARLHARVRSVRPASGTTSTKSSHTRRALPLDVLRDLMLRGLIAWRRHASSQPKQWQLCDAINANRLLPGKVLHPKTLSRWLGANHVTYNEEISALMEQARRFLNVERAQQDRPTG